MKHKKGTISGLIIANNNLHQQHVWIIGVIQNITSPSPPPPYHAPAASQSFLIYYPRPSRGGVRVVSVAVFAPHLPVTI